MNATPSRPKLILAFSAIYLIWGSTYLAIHYAIDTLPPYLMTGLRFLVAGALLTAWVRWRGGERPQAVQWRWATLVGGLLLFGGMGTVAVAQQWLPSGLTALLIATVPIWMVLIEWVRPGGVRPSSRTFVGIGLSFAGLLLLIGPANLFGQTHIHLLGAVLVLLATISWAIGSLLSRTATLPANPMLSTGMQMLAASVMLLLAGVLTGEVSQVRLEAISWSSILAWLYLIFFGSIVAMTAYLWLLRVSTPARVGTYAFVNPVIAVALGWALVGERISLQTIVAAALIVVAVIVILTQQQQQPAAKPAQAAPKAAEPLEAIKEVIQGSGTDCKRV